MPHHTYATETYFALMIKFFSNFYEPHTLMIFYLPSTLLNSLLMIFRIQF